MAEQATRISEAERESTVEALADHLVEGRLSIEEFGDRLGLAFSAATSGELLAITGDLPRPPRPAEPPLGVATPEERAARRARRIENRWTTFASVNAVLWSLWGVAMVTTGGHAVPEVWPLWITAPWGAWLLSREPGLRHARD
ncbi:MAG TPA: DUF1707 domain-containing protein [Acidimicrobiales bacterium]|nr:DUF1707 domain-containing protein [Acidimicrobiales bacterium]